MSVAANRTSATGHRGGALTDVGPLGRRFPISGFRFPFLLCVVSLLLLTSAFAVEPDEILPDPILEARAREIGRELRCVVCQSQSIDDSNAPLARDLRLLVRERLMAGDSNDEAKAFVVARYGEFVLLKPPQSAGTIALWTAPAALLALAVIAGVLALRGRHRTAPEPLTAEEEARLKDIAG